MASKPETTYRRKIERHLDDVYKLKVNNPYASGVADSWYSGGQGDMWVEYKYLPELPVRADIKLGLTELQRRWLMNRSKEGRAVWVILGSPEGGVALGPPHWDAPLPVSTFRSMAAPAAELAQMIRSVTGASPCPH